MGCGPGPCSAPLAVWRAENAPQRIDRLLDEGFVVHVDDPPRMPLRGMHGRQGVARDRTAVNFFPRGIYRPPCFEPSEILSLKVSTFKGGRSGHRWPNLCGSALAHPVLFR